MVLSIKWLNIIGFGFGKRLWVFNHDVTASRLEPQHSPTGQGVVWLIHKPPNLVTLVIGDDHGVGVKVLLASFCRNDGAITTVGPVCLNPMLINVNNGFHMLVRLDFSWRTLSKAAKEILGITPTICPTSAEINIEPRKGVLFFFRFEDEGNGDYYALGRASEIILWPRQGDDIRVEIPESVDFDAVTVLLDPIAIPPQNEFFFDICADWLTTCKWFYKGTTDQTSDEVLPVLDLSSSG